MNRLLPCPFCGQALDAQWNRPNPKARCRTEGCKGRQLPVLNLDVPEDIAAWNARPSARQIGEILLDAKGHPYARLRTGCDSNGNQWQEGTPIYAATAQDAERPDHKAWAKQWREAVESICTLVGVSPALSAMESVAAVRDKLAQDAERERDAESYRYLRSIARLVEFDGGNSGVWEIRGIQAYENWIGGPPFNHKTFDAAVIAARAQRARKGDGDA